MLNVTCEELQLIAKWTVSVYSKAAPTTAVQKSKPVAS